MSNDVIAEDKLLASLDRFALMPQPMVEHGYSPITHLNNLTIDHGFAALTTASGQVHQNSQ